MTTINKHGGKMLDVTKFLLKLGQFRTADKKIPNDSYDKLKKTYDNLLKEGKYSKAKEIALKLSTQHGLPGFYVYVTSEINQIKKERAEQEIVQQPIIQLLGLLQFMEKNLDPSETAWLTEKKQACLQLVDAPHKTGVQQEAEALSTYYSKI